MKDIVTISKEYFSKIRRKMDDGTEYWYARDLMKVLEYDSWQKFKKLIEDGIVSCKKSGEPLENHFIHMDNMVDIGSGATRKIEDYALSRYACYLVAMNGNPKKKKAIALAQTYFAVQTRKQEVFREEMELFERVNARQKLTLTEKEFSGELMSRGLTGKQVGEIRATGDRALFGGFTTKQMKNKLKIQPYKPLADYLPTVTLKAKDLATEMTTHKTKAKNFQSSQIIKKMHSSHNSSVRSALTNEGIYPEDLPPEEDIKKIKSKLNKRLAGGKNSG